MQAKLALSAWATLLSALGGWFLNPFSLMHHVLALEVGSRGGVGCRGGSTQMNLLKPCAEGQAACYVLYSRPPEI